MSSNVTKQVYLPVVVELDENGKPEHVDVDFEGAPWMYALSQENVWIVDADDDSDEYEWHKDEDAEVDAINVITEMWATWQDLASRRKQ